MGKPPSPDLGFRLVGAVAGEAPVVPRLDAWELFQAAGPYLDRQPHGVPNHEPEDLTR